MISVIDVIVDVIEMMCVVRRCGDSGTRQHTNTQTRTQSHKHTQTNGHMSEPSAPSADLALSFLRMTVARAHTSTYWVRSMWYKSLLWRAPTCELCCGVTWACGHTDLCTIATCDDKRWRRRFRCRFRDACWASSSNRKRIFSLKVKRELMQWRHALNAMCVLLHGYCFCVCYG